MEGPLSEAAVERLRRRFPILATTTYLINNSLGAMPEEVEGALAGYARSWKTRGVRSWHEGWWEMPVEVGDLVAPFLGVGAGEVSMHHNVTVASAVFLSCLDYPAPRNRIVTTDLHFPSQRYQLAGERRKGAEIVSVPTPDGIRIELDDLLAAIDERTRLVAISHALFRSAFVQDVALIADRCREAGALLQLDVYQSAGILPVELARWGIDAAVGGCLKWLCGGPGNAFLWVRPGLDAQLEPALTGWQSDLEPFAFRPDHHRIARGPWRFLTGTPNVPALCAAIPGLRILGELPIDAIRERSLRLTDVLLAGAGERGFEVRTPQDPARRGGTVTVWHPRAEELARRLLDADVLCDFRPGSGIRLSPHAYNTTAECEHALDVLGSARDALGG
ncbi:MAG TPA: aminotransferase class V-fold PLP-dependent enzyme [Thermoanaerobaculia bacterium]|nr:aminotransferase class V-fold PLP-dependent enzyme [Thermoanaerobaculia bacterium]